MEGVPRGRYGLGLTTKAERVARGDGGAEARGGRQVPARGHRRGHDLPPARVPRRAPQEDPHEQHDRTAEQGDPPPHARRRQLPGRRQRADARMSAHTVRDRERVELAPLPRHVPAWRHAGGSELTIVPRTAMTQSTQSFGHHSVVGK